MIHYTTKNLSFLKVYKFLKKKGIKNNAFFLELLDKELLDVDPFDIDNLTEDQKRRILIECTRNPWYFIRECTRIPASGLVRYELNLGNLALSWACLNNINSYIILPRQTGKTFGCMVIFVWILYFGGKNTEMMLYAQQDTNLSNNMGRIKSIRDNLPPYLQLKNTRDRDGSEMINFKPLGNSVSKMAPAKSEDIANQKFRGKSTPVINYDEHAFIPHIKNQYQSSVLTQTTVARNAEKNGLPHFICITTTAGYLNTDEGMYSHEFMENCFQFTEELYDLPIKEVKSLISNEAKRNFVHVEYQYWDLGKGDDYFEEQCKALEYDQDAIDREVLNKWKSASTIHPLGQEAINLLEKFKINPKRIVVINKIYRMKLYRDPEKLDWSIPYIIGCDTANNVGADYSAMCVLDPYTYEVVATIRTNMFSTALFARMIADLMLKYFYRSILIIERNLNGGTIADRLVEINYSLCSRIYGPPLDPKKKESTQMLGVENVNAVRNLLYGQILKIAVDDSYDRIFDKVIIDEISSLTITRNGRIDHPVGGHDDLLISFLYTRWFLIFGENKERYIDPLIVGCMLKDYEYGRGDEERMRNIRNTRLSEIEHDKKEKEFEQKRKRNVQFGENIFTSGMNVPTIKEQHEQIMNGRNPHNRSMQDKMINSMFNLVDDRFQPDMSEQIEDQNDQGELYTLDDAEMQKENDKELDENYQMQQYNKNMRKDMGMITNIVDTKSQFIRQMNANKDSAISDLNYFFKHLR